KKNSEALGSSRLMFASWPARTDVPTVFVAIEFPTNEDAAKFAPKLETLLPTLLPPPTTPEPTPVVAPAQKDPSGSPAAQLAKAPAKAAPQPVDQADSPTGNSFTIDEYHFPYVITRVGNLVCISEKSFKFEKLHPAGSKPLSQDQNFRTVRDKFATEPVFVFLNVALEDKTKPQPSP